MTFSTLATYFEKLNNTPKRLEITDILADLIKKADASEIDKILYLASGRLGPLFDNTDFALADKMLLRILAVAYNKSLADVTNIYQKAGDIGDAAFQLSSLSSLSPSSSLTAEQVYDQLLAIASDSGSGSQDRKVQIFATLLRKLDPLSAKYLVRIPLGKLRLGFSDITVLDALSVVEAGDKSLRTGIERAYNVYPDIGLIAKTIKAEGVSGLKKIKLTAGVPVLPERCSLVTSSDEMLEKSDSWCVQPKYDGLRIQIHFGVTKHKTGTENLYLFPNSPNLPNHPKVKLFSRGLEDYTPMMPEVVEAISQMTSNSPTPLKNFILDGEAVSVDPKTGIISPFNETTTRKRKHGIDERSTEAPLKVFVFDLLLLNGRDLTNEPYHTRYEELTKLLSPNPTKPLPDEASAKAGWRSGALYPSSSLISLTPQQILSDPKAISKIFEENINKNLEGIVAKKPGSTYAAGARNFNWVKMKREEAVSRLTDTIDCVILGYYFGEGKRSNFGVGAFLVGVYDDQEDVFKTLAKIGTGLTDDQWRELKVKCDALKVNKLPSRVISPISLIPHIKVDPKLVVAIRADEVTKSPLHSSGFSLRFPRLINYREKLPEDANTVKDVENLFKSAK